MPDKWAQYAQPAAAPAATEDKWAQYAQPAAAAAPAPAAAATPPASLLSKISPTLAGWRDQAEKSLNDTFTDLPSDGSMSGGSRLIAGVHNLGSHGAKTIAAPFLHPVQALQAFEPQSTLENAAGPTGTLIRMGKDFGTSVLSDYRQHGLGAAAGDVLGAKVSGDAAGGLVKIPGAAKALLTGDIAAPIVGEGVSPLKRFQTAKQLGVHLNAADATNSPTLGMVRQLNEHSLVGSPTYDAARAANVGALQSGADTTLDAMSPVSREEGGTLMQKNLESDRRRLESGATERYQDLSAAMGDRPMEGSEVLGKIASKIKDEEDPFNETYPHLVPKQAMGIINDVANRFQPGEPVKSAFVDQYGKPIYSTPEPPKGLTYPEAQNIRSRTMDVTRRTNDLTADRGIGMLKQIVGGTDDAITNSAGGLNEAQQKIYRDANQRFSEMKDRYDNPSSPLYNAIRTDNPSSLVKGIGQKTPEQVRDLIPRLGVEGTGAMQRGVAEKAMWTDQNGNRSLSGFGKRFYELPEDYREELFKPHPMFAGDYPPMTDDFHQPLKDLASTSNALKKDLNPSGTAKQGQKLAEAMAMFPTAGAPLIQYPIAKLMHNPSVVDWLMKPSATPSPFVSPAVTAATASAPKKKMASEQ